MQLPKNILVPTDFSANAEVALDYAVALAGKFDAKIHLVNAVSLQFAEYGVTVTSSMIDTLVDANQKELDRLVATRSHKAAFAPTILDVGDARNVIEQTAAKIGADLIVMGTHGRRGLKRLVLGSVAESVVRHVTCPVLLIRASEEMPK
jgi:nucleotide-binding universal stress UspA family protein